MPVSASLHDGGAELRYVAGKLRKAAARDLIRELRRGQRAAFAPLEKEIKVEAGATLPKRGGYAAVMARTVKVSVSVRTKADPAVVARVYARGRAEHRDVVAVNKGILRHKLFGRATYRSRSGEIKSGWSTTHVRSGFVDRPIDRVSDRVLRESAEAAAQVMRQIARNP
jgi:hypothetical protein